MTPVYILPHSWSRIYYNDEVGPKLRHYWLTSRGSIDRKYLVCKRPECHSLAVL